MRTAPILLAATLLIGCNDSPSGVESNNYRPDVPINFSYVELGTGGITCVNSPAFVGAVASVASQYDSYDFTHLTSGDVHTTYQRYAALPTISGESSEEFRNLIFATGNTTEDGQGCVYRTNLVRWEYARSDPRPGKGYAWKTSTSPWVSLDPGKGATQVYLYYRIVLQQGPLVVRLLGEDAVTNEGVYGYSVDVSQGSGTRAYAWEVSRNGGAWGATCGNSMSCSVSIAGSDVPSVAVRVTVTDPYSSATAAGATSVNIVPSDIAVDIQGPSIVNSGQTCMWMANVSGGTPPYSYQWSGLATGSSSDITTTVSYAGTLYLSVVDAVGAQRQASLGVSIDPNNGQGACPL